MIIDKQYLQKTKLAVPPIGQIVIAELLLRWDYLIPRKTHITIENIDRIPKDKAVIFALNHTDSYNYWPFMYKLYRIGGYPYISPWVKAKYYQNFFLAQFFKATNNIPLPSLGYIISQDFKQSFQRIPTKQEYRLLRDYVDGTITTDIFLDKASTELTQFITTPHGKFKPQVQSYKQFIQNYYLDLMQLVTKISTTALLKQNISVLIFPQGTRSIRLLQGQIGLAQIALKTNVTVIPVGCNGCDKCYPNSLPFSKGGHIVYRVGKPLHINKQLAPFAIHENYEPFTKEAKEKFAYQFRGATDLIMNEINQLLDPLYQFDVNSIHNHQTDAHRFI